MPRTSETAFNTELARVLRRKHPRWPDRIDVERTNVFSESAGLKPDIIVRHPGGLPVAVETEYTPARTVEQDARDRLGKTLRATGDYIEQALAVRIPDVLASVGQNDLEEELDNAELEFCILSGTPADPGRWPETGWLAGSVDDLSACIELAALSEDRVAQGMGILEQGIAQAAVRLREACADAPATLETIASELHQRDGVQTTRMAMAIVANALTFHMAIAGSAGIQTLDQLRGHSGRLSKRSILIVWRHILDNINYWPIFKIASDILLPIRNGTAQSILERLSEVASDLVSLGATSQHDLCGRMFQRLITDRKFLATFYTLPSSAALLAELAVGRLDIDWADRDAIAGLRVADFACGTGALLNAAYQAVLSRHRRSGGDDRAIHAAMMERALVGADIMPAATHLTASVLSSTHPSVTFENTSIVTLPYGEQSEGSGRPVAIGSLDLIEDEETIPLFGTGQERVRGVETIDDGNVNLPHEGFDLVIMNPPFTRSTGQEAEKIGIPAPAFAGFATGDEEMRLMSRHLNRIRTGTIRGRRMVGHGNAGLASNFIDLANAKLKSGGTLAVVLPGVFLGGEAWSATRQLLQEDYKNVVVVSIAAARITDRAFSADTDMAEVLVVATRRGGAEQPDNTARFVNLLRRPKTVLEAATLASAIQRIPGDLDVAAVNVGDDRSAGCSIRSGLPDTGSAGLREAGVVQAAIALVRGELRLPRQHAPIQIPVVELDQLGERGLYHMDISGDEITASGLPRGPFNIVRIGPGELPTWPALWSHSAPRESQLIVLPDRKGEVRPGCERKAIERWERTASRLHFNRDFRINSQPLAACLTPDLSIGGTAWPNFLCSDPRWEKSIVCWANTILGLMCFWWIGTRQHSGRARLSISNLPALTVLDPRALTEAQLDLADEIFARFRDQSMLPANEAWQDETRHALDRAVLGDLLGLPDDVFESLALLRRQWCAEPSVHGGKSTAPN